jgi:site-specific DNA-methyltransferase (adenine-specific)
MEAMKGMKDNQFDLAIVDPPYGIGISSNPFRQKHKKSNWDDAVPKEEYFQELKRVSKSQIIWGGNYFNLPPTQGFIIWDKVQPETFSSSMCEFAWCSEQKPAKIFKRRVVQKEYSKKIHPTQKPITLYKWILEKYAKDGDKILDTHLGSGSIAIACWDLKYDLTGYELDKEYYDGACERFNNHCKQGQLF